MLPWQVSRNIESSLKEFLIGAVADDSVTDIKGVAVPVRVGRKEDSDWTLPCITIYLDKKDSPRGFVGSNTRLKTYVIIIDIFATNEGERGDLADWLEEAINNGFRYYAYTPSESTPQTPTKVAGGLVELNFLTNARVALGQNVSDEDSHRHRISINTWISGS